MATIEPKTETITKETFVLTFDRAELEALCTDPKPYIREFRAVLSGSNQPPLKPRSRQPAAAKRAKKAKANPVIKCTFCAAPFINPGSHAKHEARCIDNPNRITE